MAFLLLSGLMVMVVLDGRIVVGQDLCEEDAQCAQVCTVIMSIPQCSCSPGYTINRDGVNCDDIIECRDRTHPHDCVPTATCANTIGSFTCTCPAGCNGDGRRSGTGCIDINECTEGTHNCGNGYRCNNTLRACSFSCDDIDECTDSTHPHDCMSTATCVNTVGSFTCMCLTGCSGDGRVSGTGCIDTNECTEGTHNCGVGYRCTNTPACSFTCIDINECTDSTHPHDCVSTATCVNTMGSFTCTCPAGCNGDGRASGTGCIDTNECTEGTHNCGVGYRCTNTPACSFTCIIESTMTEVSSTMVTDTTEFTTESTTTEVPSSIRSTTATDTTEFTTDVSTTPSPTQVTTEVVPVVIFQIRLNGVSDCLQWTLLSPVEKSEQFMSLIVQAIEQACDCGLTRDHITEERFQCFPESQQHVTFRARLTETPQATITQLIAYIEQWIATAMNVAIQSVLLGINNTCSLVIENFESPECPIQQPTVTTQGSTKTPTTAATSVTPTVDLPSQSTFPIGAIVGTALGGLIILLLIALAVTTVAILKQQKGSNKKQQTRSGLELPPIQANSVPNTEPYYGMSLNISYEQVSETVSGDHLYDEIDPPPITEYYSGCPTDTYVNTQGQRESEHEN